MSATYGVVNLIASFGFSARWRNQAIESVCLSNASHIVDLMSGMSEVCRSLSRVIPRESRVTGIDISPEMIRRARKDWPFAVQVIEGDVLDWQFEPGTADAIVCAFGLKTFDAAQQRALANVVARLLRPGGIFSFVEISVPRSPLLRAPYMFYLKRLIPLIGRLFLGNPANYSMLGYYTEQFDRSTAFAQYMRSEGLEVREVDYFFGCATGVTGSRPVNSGEPSTGG